MDRIKSRATFYAISLALILITLFTAALVQDRSKILDEKTLSHRQQLRSAFELAILDTRNEIGILAYQIAGDDSIVDAFASRNREILYQRALPHFDQAKKEGKIDLAAFIASDGKHFLRMQEPGLFGDDMTQKRPILARALEIKQPITSIDVTRYSIAIVTIVPIFKNGHFIGLLQLSADISRIQERLNAQSSIKSAIAFNTIMLKSLLDLSKFHSYDGYTVVSSNNPLFERLPGSFTFGNYNRLTLDDHEYILSSRPLLNYENREVAMMICAFDVTDETHEYDQQIRELLIVSAVLIVLMGIVLHYGFNILIRRIDKDRIVTRDLNEKLSHQLYSDHLTGLANRHALLRDISDHRFHALMLINIDNFKQINDFYGHAMGDAVLLAFARALEESIKTFPMQLYKMPSDEYAVVLIEPMSECDIHAARRAIVEYLQAQHYDMDGASIYVTVTIGMDIASGHDLNNPLNRLLNADMALKSAKKRHLNYLLYDETMQIKQEFQNNIYWSKKVNEAVEENRFTLHFQPIVDPLNGNVVEYEALVRMVETDGAIIPPNFFLPAARQSHLYAKITRFVIQNVFETVERTGFTCSINLSVDDILHRPTNEFIFSQLKSSTHPERIIFELLESEGIENYQEISTFIADVKAFGCKIAIDDFGTGYSNFAHILRLNVDILKIDGSLIRNIDTDEGAQTIVSAVVTFSRRLGLKTIAEFVHSEAVLAKCEAMGIDYMQGYHTGKPAPL
ncbi:MAG: EAL domain-containing protein [Sulfuricurvum sp.]